MAMAEIGLTGARGPKAKRHGVVADALDVPALAGGLGADGLAVIREQDIVVRAQCPRILAAKGTDEALDVVGAEAITLAGGREQLLEHACEKFDFRGIARNRDDIAAQRDIRIAQRLDRAEQLVRRPR